jgi:hypothetical protein
MSTVISAETTFEASPVSVAFTVEATDQVLPPLEESLIDSLHVYRGYASVLFAAATACVLLYALYIVERYHRRQANALHSARVACDRASLQQQQQQQPQ